MSTGLLLFLVFMALSIIDSVARARRGQQQASLPPEEGEERSSEPPAAQVSSAQASAAQAGVREAAAGRDAAAKKSRGDLDELVSLEKLMGPGYLERLMGPGFAGGVEVGEGEGPEREAAREPVASASASQAQVPPAGPAGSRDRESRAAADERSWSRRDDRIAREGRSPDQQRRRAEARRRQPGVGQLGEAPGRRPRDLGPQPGADRRLRSPRDAGSRPAREEEVAPPRDPAVPGRTVLEMPAAAVGRDQRHQDLLAPVPGRPGPGRRAPVRTGIYRELFGSGDRDSLRRAFVLKEILDAPASERREDRREQG